MKPRHKFPFRRRLAAVLSRGLFASLWMRWRWGIWPEPEWTWEDFGLDR